ncbi:hypothetical protein ACHAXA_004106 [Cyclostephanos tholiformis]|uniref:RING-type domain-containing protein n=1 Tax=Cyclostephanos tholiformis TaxID=382380 RepID=A0ABD3SGX6_9STRA
MTTTSEAKSATTSKRSNSAAMMAVPDISSLAAIPILSNVKRTNVKRRRLSTNDDDISRIHLLPKLFNSSKCSKNDIKSNTAGEYTIDDKFTSVDSRVNNHPCRELVRIASDLEVQLKERLSDASEGAIAMQTRDDSDMNAADNTLDDHYSASAAGIHEEFLLRCGAIMLELLSAIQQQLRKEQSQHWKKLSASSSRPRASPSKNSSKRFNSSSPSMTSTNPPPLKYYSALARQLQVLQNMPNVMDISIHDQLPPAANTDNNDMPPQDLVSISITCHDEGKRSHMWHAELFPSVVLTVDLPAEFVLEDNYNRQIRLERWWEDDLPVPDTSSNGGVVSSASARKTALLQRIQHCFETALQRYQPLFDELDDLDTHFWILEPTLPARRSNVERRIALWEGGASLVIALDPDNPRGVPLMVRFLGVTLATMKAAAASGCGQGIIRAGGTTAGCIVDWRTSFSEFVSDEEEDGGRAITVKNNSQSKAYTVINQNLFDDHKSTKTPKLRWSKERSIRENLELWFGSPLPSPLSSFNEKSDFLVECGICYTHRLPTEDSNTDEGHLPEVKCGNPSCSRHYHESCLFEWLHSLPTARVSFDRIFGSCMYCSQGISVKILNGASNQV